jgi:hypothetical protein
MKSSPHIHFNQHCKLSVIHVRVTSSFMKHTSPLNTVMNITNTCTSVTPVTDKKTKPKNHRVPHTFHYTFKSLTSFTMLLSPPQAVLCFQDPHKFHCASKVPHKFHNASKSLTHFTTLLSPSQVAQCF